MDWFLYDRDLHYTRVKDDTAFISVQANVNSPLEPFLLSNCTIDLRNSKYRKTHWSKRSPCWNIIRRKLSTADNNTNDFSFNWLNATSSFVNISTQYWQMTSQIWFSSKCFERESGANSQRWCNKFTTVVCNSIELYTLAICPVSRTSWVLK